MKRFVLVCVALLSYVFNHAQSSLPDILSAKLGYFNYILPYEKVYLQSDRTIYKPGDDIWMAVWITNGITNKPSFVSEIVNVELVNPKGNVIANKRILSTQGRAACDFAIDTAAAGGQYKIRAYTNWMQNFGEPAIFTKEIQIQTVDLPRLLMKLSFDRKAYGAGDSVQANLSLQNLYNQPLTEYPFAYEVSLEGGTKFKQSMLTDLYGKAEVKFPLPQSLKTNDGILNVAINYKGTVEAISRSIPIVLNQIDLQFLPEGGDLVADIDNNVAFKALNEFGKPADVEGTVFNQLHQIVGHFKSYHQGMGAFRFKPLRGGRYYALIDKPVGVMQMFVLPEPVENGFLMELPNPQSFVNPSQNRPSEIRIFSPLNTQLTLLAQINGNICLSKTFNVIAGENLISVDLTKFPSGVAQFTLFTKENVEVAERLVFVKKHQQLKVELETDKSFYGMRDEVVLKIKTSSPDGKPVRASLGLAVVDNRQLTLADDKSDNILSYLNLSSELTGKIDEPNFYFDPSEAKADSAIDYLLLTQGWRRFTWKEIAEGTPEKWTQGVTNNPEKMTLSGRVIGKPNEMKVTQLFIKETGQKAVISPKGYYEFRHLDLTTPVTLVAVSSKNDTIKQTIRDYSSRNYINQNAISRGSNQEMIIEEDQYCAQNEYDQRSGPAINIKGKVVDESGEPIIGCTLYVKGIYSGTISDIGGNFKLQARRNDVVCFSFMGFKTLELPVNQIGKIVLMNKESVSLDEVIVVGYGIQRRAFITGAVRQVSKQKNFSVEVNQENTSRKSNQNVIQPVGVKSSEINSIAASIGSVDYDRGTDDEADIPVTTDESMVEEVQEPFIIVEQMPEFQGGQSQLLKFISSHIVYPQYAIENGIQGTVYLRFVIDKFGAIGDVSVLRKLHPLLDQEAIRVIRQMPRWKPGRQGGREVAVSYTIPVRFALQDGGGGGNRGVYYSNYAQQNNDVNYYKAREFYVPKYVKDDDVKERTDFRKTIYWQPVVSTDSLGYAEVRFFTSDESTTFKAIAEGIDQVGCIGRNEATFYTSKALSVEIKMPQNVITGDTLSIPVIIENRTSKTISGKLTCILTGGIKMLQPLPSQVDINADSALVVYVNVAVEKPENGNLSASIASEFYKDAVSVSYDAVSGGFPVSTTYLASIANSQFFITVPEVVPYSLNANFTAYTNQIATIGSAVKQMIREPHGCFEQVSSTAYPNILALQYLNRAHLVDSAFQSQAYKYIVSGYNQLIKFECNSGGFEWFGKGAGHEGLTAYGLMELNDMKQVGVNIDNELYQRTLTWLLGRKDNMGGFKAAPGKYGFTQQAGLLNNAYVVYALSEIKCNQIRNEFEKAYADNSDKNDAYRLALLANAAYNLQDSVKGNAIIKRLNKVVLSKSMENLTAETSITGSGGQSLKTETVSLIALALMKQKNCDTVMLKQCISYILKQRNSGSFGSTQANVLALKVLTFNPLNYAYEVKEGNVNIHFDGKTVVSGIYQINQSNVFKMDSLQNVLHPGGNKVNVEFENHSLVPHYEINVKYNQTSGISHPACGLEFETSYSRKQMRMGETLRLKIDIANKRNTTTGMVIAIIQIPSGLSVQPWQLKDLSEKQYFDYYEIKGNQLYLYFRALSPKVKGIVNLDLLAEIPGRFFNANSCCYEYYRDEYKAWSDAGFVEVIK